MTAKNSSHALCLISDKDRQSVSALAATITKNKTFIKQQIMHSTTTKKEPGNSHKVQPGVVSLHTTVTKSKNGNPMLVLVGGNEGNQTPHTLKQQTFFSYNQDANSNNVLPSIEDQQYNPLMQNQQQHQKVNSILSPNRQKSMNRTDAIKKNIMDQQLVMLYDNFHNPMNVVGGPNNRTLIECYLQK